MNVYDYIQKRSQQPFYITAAATFSVKYWSYFSIMWLWISGRQGSAVQKWRFQVESNRRCDLTAPQMEHEHTFPLMSHMINSYHERVFFCCVCVCVQLVWPNKHVGGESKVLRDLGQAKNIFMTNQILEMLYAYVNISQTVCDILKFCPFLYSTRSCECMYSYISVPTHINYHPVFFRHVVNSEKAKQWQPDQSIRWIYQIKIHLPSLLAPGWLIFPHLCFSSWSPASVSVALPSLQPTECAPAPSTDIIVANEQICCSLISSI